MEMGQKSTTIAAAPKSSQNSNRPTQQTMLQVVIPLQPQAIAAPSASASSTSAPSSSSIKKTKLVEDLKSRTAIPKRSTYNNASTSVASSSIVPSSPSSSTSSDAFGSRGRHQGHFHGLADPFGPTKWESAKRCLDDDDGMYRCQWRLTDRKSVLDPQGPTFCHRNLITAEALAKHVLVEHVSDLTEESRSNGEATNSAFREGSGVNDIERFSRKQACKWSGCMNRRFDAQGLASHLVYDHFTMQLGYKYACPLVNCPTKPIMTSDAALERHIMGFHKGVAGEEFRQIWGPILPKTSQPKILPELFTTSLTLANMPAISISKTRDVKMDPDVEENMEERTLYLKLSLLSAKELRVGDGRIGAPWDRLHRRVQARMKYHDALDGVERAIFEGDEYEESDLVDSNRNWLVAVDPPVDPVKVAIRKGLEQAQPYRQVHARASSLSSSTSAVASSSSAAARTPQPVTEQRVTSQLPSPFCIEVTSEAKEEGLCESSSFHLERELDFERGSKQHAKMRQIVFNLPSTSESALVSSSSPTKAPLDPASYYLDSGDDEWAPPLKCDLYHPLSRRLPTLGEDSTTVLSSSTEDDGGDPNSPRSMAGQTEKASAKPAVKASKKSISNTVIRERHCENDDDRIIDSVSDTDVVTPKIESRMSSPTIRSVDTPEPVSLSAIFPEAKTEPLWCPEGTARTAQVLTPEASSEDLSSFKEEEGERTLESHSGLAAAGPRLKRLASSTQIGGSGEHWRPVKQQRLMHESSEGDLDNEEFGAEDTPEGLPLVNGASFKYGSLKPPMAAPPEVTQEQVPSLKSPEIIHIIDDDDE